ncbi:hypothetical protein ONZ45_g8178 [Pleurotus djamor]|nr:hypothetical protein ONZ45_g8178 [Pleurotus djamor]
MDTLYELPRNANPAFALLGLLLGTLLYGAILVQSSKRPSMDSHPGLQHFKALSSWFSSVAQVGYLVLMETGMIAFTMWGMYYTMDSMFYNLAHTPREEFSAYDATSIWELVLGIILVGTGAITALLTVLDAALYYRGAETLFEGMPFVYVIPEMMISKLYTNSLLATLNARLVWRDYLPTPGSAAAKGWSSLPSIKIVQQKVNVTSDPSS